MKAPKLENNQHSVLTAESNTGKVLTTEFIRYNGHGEVFHIFETYNLALDFIKNNLSEKSTFEFVLYDSNGEYLMIIDAEGKRT